MKLSGAMTMFLLGSVAWSLGQGQPLTARPDSRAGAGNWSCRSCKPAIRSSRGYGCFLFGRSTACALLHLTSAGAA